MASEKVENVFETTISDTDHSSGVEENSMFNIFASFGIHIAMIIIVICLKWQYDRNRYRYPKGPRDWRNIKDAISFHRKKGENLLRLATDFPDTCTVMTHVGRLVLLNNPILINEIFIGRADLVSNKIDGYLENQLRYREGKHIRTGIVFRHYDHNSRIIHKALVNYSENNSIDKYFNSFVQNELKQIRFSDKFDVRRTTFYFSVRLLTSLTCSSTIKTNDDKTFELFEQNLYKISKAIHEDTIAKSTKVVIAQLTGLSQTLDINENVLDYVKTWIQQRYLDKTETKYNDYLEAILNVLSESSPNLDENDLTACVLDIIMHGSELLKGALSWILLYVVQHREEADLCRREAQDKNYSTFDISSAESLVYSQAFVKEVLRLSPVVIHTTLQDFRWRTYHVQKRTEFGANIVALHHSTVWKNAMKFDITRWIGDNAASIPTTHYAPFGFGPRSCIAEKYLFHLLTGILSVLLYHNDFEKVDKLPEPSEGTFGLANMPPKYSLKATSFSARI